SRSRNRRHAGRLAQGYRESQTSRVTAHWLFAARPRRLCIAFPTPTTRRAKNAIARYRLLSLKAHSRPSALQQSSRRADTREPDSVAFPRSTDEPATGAESPEPAIP